MMNRALTKLNMRKMWRYWAVLIYALAFFTSRLTNITSFPLYIDEVTHIFVAKLTVNGDFFIGLSETAKQLYVWLVAISYQIFDDPIYAARFVSVLAGLINAGICYKLTNIFYPKRRIGYLAALFYLISPFAILFDRMALADSLLATLMGASILASFQLWRSASVKWALLLGVVFGLAVLNKAYAVFYYPAPILLWLLLGRTIPWRKITKLLAITYATSSIAWLMIFFIGQLAYQDYLQKKSITGSGATDFFARSWNFTLLMAEWLGSYLTLPLVGLLLFTLGRLLIKRDRYGYVLILLVIGPLFGFALAFTDLYSRYLFPLIVPLSVMIAWGIAEAADFVRLSIEKIKLKGNLVLPVSHIISIAILLVLSIPALLFSYQIIVEPNQAPFPAKDKESYIVHAQSAQGYSEIAQSMDKLVQHYGKLIFLRNSLPSPLEVILSVYFSDEVTKHMDIVPIGSFEQITPQSLNNYASQAPTVTVERDLIVSSDSNPNQSIYSPLWQVASFSNPSFPSSIGLYQWLLPPDFAVRWLQQGGDPDPVIAWQQLDIQNESDTFLTTAGGTLVDWLQVPVQTLEMLQEALIRQNIEYVLATPALVQQDEALFAPFLVTDGQTLTLKQIPPGWRLAYAYPDLKCQWCLFQLRPPNHPTQVIFGETIALEGYDISPAQAQVGEAFYITLYWHSLTAVSESYVVFVHLLDGNGNLVSQVDELPFAGQWSTNSWQVGNRLADRHTLLLDSALPQGEYTISVGLYNPTNMERLAAQSPESLVRDNAVSLAEVSICHTCPGKE